MQRIGLRLQIKPGLEIRYDRMHQMVWPELVADLRAAGVVEYSIFRNGLELFLVLHVQEVARFEEAMRRSEANRRWQEMMQPFWDEPSASSGPVRMPEVFYLAPDDVSAGHS